MAKFALLIGVSEYKYDLTPLPSAVRDVNAIQQVLQHPEMGEFDPANITVLKNPNRSEMDEAIEELFSSRQKDDLVLFFFSGHGVFTFNDENKLYLATRGTRKSIDNNLVRSTAVPASFIHECMERSKSKRQIIILDSCFSGAFAKGMSVKDLGDVDISSQLGGEGRAVLTSSTSTQLSFEQKGSELSVYTQYLVEGIRTGNADQDEDGFISTDELHEYARRKVLDSGLGMKPEIYAAREGFKIRLARVPIANPNEKYRKEVKRYISRGEISFVRRQTLNVLRVRLAPFGLSITAADSIEEEELRIPHQEFQAKLAQYEQTFAEAIRREGNLSETTLSELQSLQRELGLLISDTVPIETRVQAQVRAHQQGIVQYQRTLFRAIRQKYPLSSEQQSELLELQQLLKLTDKEVCSIQAQIIAQFETHQQCLRQYEQAVTEWTQHRYQLDASVWQELKQLQRELNLTDQDTNSINVRITAEVEDYHRRLHEYEQAWVQATQRRYSPSSTDRNHLHQLQQNLALHSDDTESISGRITVQIETYQHSLRAYEQAFSQALQQQYPFSKLQRQQLSQQRQQFKLIQNDANQSEQRLTAEWQDYQNRLQRYEETLADLMPRDYPFTNGVQEELHRLQQVLELSDVDVLQIEQRLVQRLGTAIVSQPIFKPSKSPWQLNLPSWRIPHFGKWARAMGMVVATGILGAGSYSGLQNWLEQIDQSKLTQLSALQGAAKYSDCITQAGALTPTFRFFKAAQTVLNECRLKQAETLAKGNKLTEAIVLANQIPANAPTYKGAADAISSWLKSLIGTAEKQYQAGNMDSVKALLNGLPQEGSTFTQAHQKTDQWQQEWAMNEKTLNEAQTALNKKDWEAAKTATVKLNHPYWKQKAQSIVQKADQQIEASQRPITPLETVVSEDTRNLSSGSGSGISNTQSSTNVPQPPPSKAFTPAPIRIAN